MDFIINGRDFLLFNFQILIIVSINHNLFQEKRKRKVQIERNYDWLHWKSSIDFISESSFELIQSIWIIIKEKGEGGGFKGFFDFYFVEKKKKKNKKVGGRQETKKIGKMSSLDYVPCEDFTPFKNALMKHRKTDDNVMHLLNTTNVHSETKCQELFAAFTKSHAERGVLINRCLNVQIQKVDDLKKQLEVDKNNLNLKTELRTEQLKVQKLSYLNFFFFSFSLNFSISFLFYYWKRISKDPIFFLLLFLINNLI